MTNLYETKTIKRIIAGILSVITVFSLCTVAVTTGSAATDELVTTKYKGHTLKYSDGFFRHSSTEYDPHLATLSCIMTHFSMPLNNPSSVNDKNWYSSQPERLNGFFDSIGFNDFETNDDYRNRTEFDTIGVGAASKQVGDYTVIGVGIRSGGYFREWSNNVYLGDGTKSDYMHEGWYNAANKTIKFIDKYITDKSITGKIKIWIAGFSRGGATANLTAGLLDNKINNNEKLFANDASLEHSDLYAYTFEAPQGANYNSKNVKLPGDKIYNNIWNVVNPNDLVPKVAMSEYGFTRFGTDKYITTQFFDPANFKNNRDVFKALYANNGQAVSGYKADDFKMYGTPLKKVAPVVAKLVAAMPLGVADIVYKIKAGQNPVLSQDSTKANYDGNIAEYMLVEEMTKNIGSRGDYCKKYQGGVSNFLLAMMSDVDALKKDELLSFFTKIILSETVSSLPGCGGLAQKVAKDALRGRADANEIVKAVDPLLKVIGKVYWERPNELISIGIYINEVFQTHDTDVNIAHLEAQDSNYIDSYNEDKGGKLTLVPLRDNADFGRVSFKDFNDIGLYSSDAKTKFVSVSGKKVERSVINQCAPGFAVGYYSYATEEKMELFMPVNQQYILNMKGYSIKPKHDVWYNAVYQSVGPNSSYRIKEARGSFSDWFFMNTKFLQKSINMNF